MMAKSYSELQSLKQIIRRTILFTTFVAEEIEVMALNTKQWSRLWLCLTEILGNRIKSGVKFAYITGFEKSSMRILQKI
jgi:hypothetical protein